jgi:hypothetical protein
MTELVQLAGTVISALVGGIAAYAAIKSDLADLKARMQLAEEANKRAHERIDDLFKGPK